MELIDAKPENISNIKLADLDNISRQHYNSNLDNENKNLKKQIEETNRKIRIESNEKNERKGKRVEKILKIFVGLFFITICAISLKVLYSQWEENNNNYLSIIPLGISFLGIIDTIVLRYRYFNKPIMAIVNKYKMKVALKEDERIQKILKS